MKWEAGDDQVNHFMICNICHSTWLDTGNRRCMYPHGQWLIVPAILAEGEDDDAGA